MSQQHFPNFSRLLILSSVLAIAVAGSAAAQEIAFHVDPAQSAVKFTLSDVLHTVHGTFQVKRGAFELEADGKMSGEVVVDAASGDSGSGMRDRKMNKEVLETERYPEISFRPDRVDGPVANWGRASVMVHGIFSIHGMNREITLPVSLETTADHWSASVRFTVPYEKWGMKNPSTLFLKVNEAVEIELAAAGSVVRNPAASSQK